MNMTHVRRQRLGKGDLDKLFIAGQKAHKVRRSHYSLHDTQQCILDVVVHNTKTAIEN